MGGAGSSSPVSLDSPPRGSLSCMSDLPGGRAVRPHPEAPGPFLVIMLFSVWGQDGCTCPFTLKIGPLLQTPSLGFFFLSAGHKGPPPTAFSHRFQPGGRQQVDEMGVWAAYSCSWFLPPGPPLLNLGYSRGGWGHVGTFGAVSPAKTPFASLKVVSPRGVGKGSHCLGKETFTSPLVIKGNIYFPCNTVILLLGV